MSRAAALAAVLTCALIWGTTWYAITFQLGEVDPIVSVTLRFGLAAVVLLAVCAVMRRRLVLTGAQHLAALGQGAFVFAISYAFVYAAEEKVPSAIVAVIFASLAFLNLVLFRALSGQKAAPAAWGGAAMGLAGVAVLSGGAFVETGLDARAATGIGFALLAVCSSTLGNWFAWRGERVGSDVLPATAWAMTYGTIMLALWGLAAGVEWRIETTPAYLISLLYLSLFGSVIAFGLYFTIARARGYAMASYISALTPPVAVVVSVLFEGAQFGWTALVGLGLVLGGQVLLIRAPRPADG